MNQQTERGEGPGPAGQATRQQVTQDKNQEKGMGTTEPVRSDSPLAYDDAYETERENDFDQEETGRHQDHDEPR